MPRAPVALRSVLLALVCAPLLPAIAPAQSYSANLQATVTSVVSIVKLTDLAFGSTAIVPGAAAAIAPASGGVARVDYNEPVLVTVQGFAMLTGPYSTRIRVDLACAQATAVGATAPALFGSGCAGGFTPTLGGNASGSHFIYVGGTVAPSASGIAVAGSYSGNFSITASYVVY